MLQRLLFQIAKGPLMGFLVGIAFRYCCWAIPVKKVYQSKEIIAFRHPQPSYENHVILSPRKVIKDLRQLASDHNSSLFLKTWEAVKRLCETHPAYHDAFVLVANGGKRQEVQQVHFHLFTNGAMVHDYAVRAKDENVLYQDQEICVIKHPNPNWEFHFVVTPSIRASEGHQDTYIKNLLRSIDQLNASFHIVQKGYSLVCQHKKKNDMEHPVFHIVSGKKLFPAE